MVSQRSNKGIPDTELLAWWYTVHTRGATASHAAAGPDAHPVLVEIPFSVNQEILVLNDILCRESAQYAILCGACPACPVAKANTVAGGTITEN